MTYTIQENSYGHLKRLKWIESQISPADSICEIGCGTGAMIVRPLLQRGFRIVGVDPDEKSIQFGRELLQKEGLAPLLFREFPATEELFDVVIVSEVLEHLNDSEYPAFFRLLKSKLKKGGKLLVTVPNGSGWHELESDLYHRKNIGGILKKLKIISLIKRLKTLLLRSSDWYDTIPSTLSESPHVQRFAYKSIQHFLRKQGFEILAITGSALFSGPFSELLWGGFRPFLQINNRLGSWFPRISSGFYVSCSLL